MAPKTIDDLHQLVWRSEQAAPVNVVERLIDLHFAGADVGLSMGSRIVCSLSRPIARPELAEHSARVACRALRSAFALAV
eukprot:937955-Heterocapsa_arctica.AAC.1